MANLSDPLYKFSSIFFTLYLDSIMLRVYIKVDILDTAGNLEFPAMRRLSISTAHAFLLVFAVDDRDSFAEIRQLWDLIGELRTNREEIPCVIAANKVIDWLIGVFYYTPNVRCL